MPIVASDIHVRLSGGAVNSAPTASLGGVKSSTSVVDATEGNKFANVGSAEALAGSTKYRGFYAHNNHGSLTLQSTVIWISSQTPSTGTDIAIALAGEGLNATMETIANEDTAPVGETFSAPATKGAGLSMGNIPTTQHYGYWERRIVQASSSAFNNDDWDISIEGDTDA